MYDQYDLMLLTRKIKTLEDEISSLDNKEDKSNDDLTKLKALKEQLDTAYEDYKVATDFAVQVAKFIGGVE